MDRGICVLSRSILSLSLLYYNGCRGVGRVINPTRILCGWVGNGRKESKERKEGKEGEEGKDEEGKDGEEDDGDVANQDDGQKLDERMPEADNLDLPDDMQLDGDDKNDDDDLDLGSEMGGESHFLLSV